MSIKHPTASNRPPHRQLLVAASLVVGLAAFATAGCDKAKEALNKAKKVSKVAKKVTGGSSDKGDSPEGRAISAMSKKMNAYADCLNVFGRNVGNSRSRYLSWVDPKAGPTGKERHIYGVHKVNLDPEKRCAAKVRAVAGLEPAMPDLESAADGYAKALKDATSVINEAEAYYKSKAYKKDDMAKGRALHPKLMTAFETFMAADRELSKHFDRADDSLAERRLAHLATTQGKKMRYRHLVLMQHAKRLFRATRTAEPMTLADLDDKAADDAANAMAAVTGDATQYAQSHRKEFPTASSYSQVGRAAQELVNSARSLVKRKRDGTVFTGKETWLRTGNAKRQVGHPAHTTDKYNALVDASNRLRL